MDLPADLLLLALKNAHARDARIRFDEKAHIYFIDGAKYPSSVSGIIHDHFPSFDAVGTVEKYYANWARNKENKYFPLINYLTRVLGFPEQVAKGEIARSWNAAGTHASSAGTHTHLQIEYMLNGEAHVADTPEFRQFLEWKATHPTWEAYRTEWSVFSEPELCCGQIDSIFQDEHGALHMVDWKRVADMKMVSGFQNQCGFDPVHALPNTNFYHYVLQQNIYSWMVEQRYGLQIASMCLVQVHPDISTFKEHPLPRIDKEVGIIMERRRERVTAGELVTVSAEMVAASALKRKEHPADESLEAARRAGILKYLRARVAELEAELEVA